MDLGSCSCSRDQGRYGPDGKTAADASLIPLAVKISLAVKVLAITVLTLIGSFLSAQVVVLDSGPVPGPAGVENTLPPSLVAVARRPAKGSARLREGQVVAARIELESKNSENKAAPIPEARIIKRAVSPGPRAGRRGARDPWVTVRRLKAPGFEDDELSMDTREIVKVSPWYLEDEFDKPIFDEPPAYVDYNPGPSFSMTPPGDARITRALKRLARKKFYVELRRGLKSEWRKNYETSSGMTYDKYEEQMLRINEIGREAHEYDRLVGNYYSNELKGALFEEGYEGGERDIQLLGWGPFTIMDSGSMKVHFEKLFNSRAALPQLGEPEKPTPGREGILLSEKYRVDTNIRLGFDVGQLFEEGDVAGLLESYGFSISVDWLSKILGRELLTTEFEAEIDRQGDYAFALNFVLIGR